MMESNTCQFHWEYFFNAENKLNIIQFEKNVCFPKYSNFIYKSSIDSYEISIKLHVSICVLINKTKMI